MKTLKTCVVFSLVLGVISLIWLALDFAALTDIWHGLEPNYELEWQIVSWGFIPLTLFHIAALTTLTLFLRYKSVGEKTAT